MGRRLVAHAGVTFFRETVLPELLLPCCNPNKPCFTDGPASLLVFSLWLPLSIWSKHYLFIPSRGTPCTVAHSCDVRT